jgi:hypothetical protein
LSKVDCTAERGGGVAVSQGEALSQGEEGSMGVMTS